MRRAGRSSRAQVLALPQPAPFSVDWVVAAAAIALVVAGLLGS